MNGEVHCFTGGHIALGLLAIFILLAALMLLPLIVLMTIGKLNVCVNVTLVICSMMLIMCSSIASVNH